MDSIETQRTAQAALNVPGKILPVKLCARIRLFSFSFIPETHSVNAMAGYERLVAEDDAHAGVAHVDIIAQQERAKKRKLFREKIERFLWVVVGAFLVWFGDGTNNLGQIMLQRAKDTRYGWGYHDE